MLIEINHSKIMTSLFIIIGEKGLIRNSIGLAQKIKDRKFLNLVLNGLKYKVLHLIECLEK
jgi:hypothetical protein